MPYKVVKSGMKYKVKNTTTGKMYSKKGMCKACADKQKKVLDMMKNKNKKKSGY